MIEQQNDDAVLTSDGLTVRSGNKTYKLKRLPATAFFKITAVIREIFLRGLPYVSNTGENLEKTLTNEGLSTVLIMGLPYAETEVIDFLAMLTGLKPEDFGNPDKVPLVALANIIGAIDSHPDVIDFLEQAETLRSAATNGWVKAISLVFPEYQEQAKAV